MELTKNTASFEKEFALFTDAGKGETKAGPEMAASILTKLVRLGYRLDADAYERLCGTSDEQTVCFYNEVMPFLASALGNGSYKPLYSGFPQQGMELGEVNLFLNAIRHYDSQGTWVPDEYTKSRPTLFEHTSLTSIQWFPESAEPYKPDTQYPQSRVWIYREEFLESSLTWYPQTVRNSFTVTLDSPNAIMVAIDPRSSNTSSWTLTAGGFPSPP